jgi:hypothetical protein
MTKRLQDSTPRAPRRRVCTSTSHDHTRPEFCSFCDQRVYYDRALNAYFHTNNTSCMDVGSNPWNPCTYRVRGEALRMTVASTLTALLVFFVLGLHSF